MALTLIFTSLIGWQLYRVNKFKNEIQDLNRYKIIKDVMEVSSREKNIIKGLRDINSVILEELQMDYSSFFIYNEDTDEISLKETNLINERLNRELTDIKEYRAEYEDTPRDFREVFEENKYIILFSEVDLEYPTAGERGIKSSILIPLIFNSKAIGYWLIEDCSTKYSKEIDKEQLVILADQLAAVIASGLYTYLDPLLNIPKRDFLLEFIEDSMQNKDKTSVVFADIDHFKSVNDNYGHNIGDQVLKIVAQLFQQSIRTTDMVGRYGGEEIVFCLPDINKEDAVNRIEDIRRNLERAELELSDETIIKITASFGVVTYPDEFSGKVPPEEILKKADERVYIAKEQGRNRVVYR
ncbi:sensor domain-containing diguanylate cyclase [Sporosalibacterium faouarense]|uniref:sensor domain-containing diguanylate cyclase n=1 Tax=Sporosalibacterium faouarense TaxID=516123 RepID=UPI00192B3FC2|nr:sensor domain-containing diguanylate cyclase [Sporosalibacterium faouarense]